MPCYDGIGEALQKQANEEHKKVVQLLCATCKVMEKEGVKFSKVSGLKEWWEEHQMIDALNYFYTTNRDTQYLLREELSIAIGYGGIKEFIKKHPQWCAKVLHQFH